MLRKNDYWGRKENPNNDVAHRHYERKEFQETILRCWSPICWQAKKFKDSVSIEFGNTVIVDEIIQSCLNGVMGKEASSVRTEG